MGEYLNERWEPKPEKDVDYVRGRHMLDGAESLEEAAQMLDREAAGLRKLARNGWKLVAPVEEDRGVIHKERKR